MGKVLLSMALALATSAASAQTSYLELVGVTPDPSADEWTVENGHVAQHSPMGFVVDCTWTVPPQRITNSGFQMKLEVAVKAPPRGSLYAGLAAKGGLNFSPNPASVEASAENGTTTRNAVTVTVSPVPSNPPGTLIYLSVGAFYGRGVTYQYRAE